jgi:hypothetical protein
MKLQYPLQAGRNELEDLLDFLFMDDAGNIAPYYEAKFPKANKDDLENEFPSESKDRLRSRYIIREYGDKIVKLLLQACVRARQSPVKMNRFANWISQNFFKKTGTKGLDHVNMYRSALGVLNVPLPPANRTINETHLANIKSFFETIGIPPEGFAHAHQQRIGCNSKTTETEFKSLAKMAILTGIFGDPLGATAVIIGMEKYDSILSSHEEWRKKQTPNQIPTSPEPLCVPITLEEQLRHVFRPYLPPADPRYPLRIRSATQPGGPHFPPTVAPALSAVSLVNHTPEIRSLIHDYVLEHVSSTEPHIVTLRTALSRPPPKKNSGFDFNSFLYTKIIDGGKYRQTHNSFM